MSGTIRVTHSRTTVHGSTTEGKSAHLEDTQFTGIGDTTDGAVKDLMQTITKYGWSGDPDQYHIVEGHGHGSVHFAP